MVTDLPTTTQVRIDAGRVMGELPHNWNYIGYDEINYTYTPEGQALLAKFMDFQEKPYYIRAHHLLCTGNCHGFYKWGQRTLISKTRRVVRFTIGRSLIWCWIPF
jgi:xylan 1,4-beta-xylosidase